MSVHPFKRALGLGVAALIAACSESGSNGETPSVEVPLQPFVMLLVDTSGSMEYKASCVCETPGCTECLPDCDRAERNRYVDVLEALSGRFEDYGCERFLRTAELGATYDSGYFLPYHRPLGEQGDDGVLDQYRDRLRFGSATFDGWDTYKGAPPLIAVEEFDHERSAGSDGLWSYNLERDWSFAMPLAADGVLIGQVAYPGTTADYYIDTGIRGSQAEDGQLLFPPMADALHVRDTNALIQAVLRETRPYGGTPIAAALDDLYYFMGFDERMSDERATPGPKYVVLITDGRPDNDYRDLGCACMTWGDNPYRCVPSGQGLGREIPFKFTADRMHCPYPLAEDTAHALRCGRGEACDGPVERVYVVGHSMAGDELETEITLERLDAIAVAGGGRSVRVATDVTELRKQLEAVLEEIATQP